MHISKKVKLILGLLLLGCLTFSSNLPFKRKIQVRAACGADGSSCTTAQNCPGVCYSGTCGDIADNCPAQVFPPAGDSVIKNPILGSGLQGVTGVGLIQKLVPYAIRWGFIIGVVLFFFMLLIGAIRWISSSGDKQRLESARGTITSALIGLVILFSLFAIIRLIQTIFGVNLLEFAVPTI